MSQVPIKETSNDLLSRVGYWPGHVIAESLALPSEESSKDRTSNNRNHSQQSMENESSSKKTTTTTSLKPGSAFSAMISSMLPIDLLTGATRPDDYVYDEFGFRIERDEDENKKNNDSNDFVNIRLSPVPHNNKKKPSSPSSILSRAFVEDSKHKLKWIAYLEFTMNADIGSTFSWDQITSLNRCEKLRAMIRGQGVPHSLRSFIWMRMSGALEKKLAAKFKYADLFKNIEHDQYHTSKQIEKDLLRTLPSNICFSSAAGVGIPRLRRILQALAWLYPSIGYCQGMGTVAASLLLFIEEEDAFWIMSAIIEDILPASYYSHTLLGVQADMKVLRQLISTYLPRIDEKLREHDIELSLVCINWFLTIFSNVFHMRILLRVWDLFFYEGSPALFQITLAMLKMNEQALVDSQSSSQIFTILSDIPSEISDIDELIETSIRIASSVNKSVLDVSRRKHQAYLMAQNGSIINPANYQSLPLVRERAQFRKLGGNGSSAAVESAKSGVETKGKNLLKLLRRSFRNDPNNNNSSQANKNHESVRSLASEDVFGHSGGGDDLNEAKMKNIMQTELLVNLRDIILKIAHYFQARDPDMYNDVSLNADYSIESHTLDYERYMDTSKVKGFKRAKAVLDFEKSDEDELGFKRNDIITVLSTKDDHCWIGELNGQKGWFPSRFVSLIDERNGKVYSAAGDDSVDERIRDLVRGEFWLALKAVFEHGLKRFHVLGSTMHPWSFIEEAARKVVEKDFQSVYSRLVLCKTFRLDEDGKVLTPDELLFRSIKLINLSHDSYRANMDVKFRSLICIGLNEQVLHIWLETLCSSLETVEKWYHEWSFLRSPGWVQIKCELRILSQFSFLLNVDAELPDTKKDLAINECIKDMLVKHHLFSWEI